MSAPGISCRQATHHEISIMYSHTSYGVFTLADSDSYADTDTDSCTEKAPIDINRLAPRSMLNGYRTHLSQPRSRLRSSGNTFEQDSIPVGYLNPWIPYPLDTPTPRKEI